MRIRLSAVQRVSNPLAWIAGIMILALCSAYLMRAQDAGSPTQPHMMAKDADPDWEVVAVKQEDPNSTEGGFWIHDRGLEIKGKTAEQLLLYGYGLHESQVLNAPDWMRSERWHTEGFASVPGQPNREQMGSLVRKLLAERFGLVMHHEQREMRVFALVMAKGGPKMTPSVDDSNGPMHENDSQSGGQATMRVKNVSSGELAGMLMRLFLDRPVVDETGLTRRYDFQLKWTQDETHAPIDGSAPPGLFTAIQEQLGLKLEPTKAMADVMVIDKVERPSTNLARQRNSGEAHEEESQSVVLRGAASASPWWTAPAWMAAGILH